MNYYGIRIRLLDAREIILTDETFGRAQVNFEETGKRFQQKISNLKEHVFVSGFIASSAKDRKSTRLNSSHIPLSRMPSSA